MCRLRPHPVWFKALFYLRLDDTTSAVDNRSQFVAYYAQFFDSGFKLTCLGLNTRGFEIHTDIKSVVVQDDHNIIRFDRPRDLNLIPLV